VNENNLPTCLLTFAYCLFVLGAAFALVASVLFALWLRCFFTGAVLLVGAVLGLAFAVAGFSAAAWAGMALAGLAVLAAAAGLAAGAPFIGSFLTTLTGAEVALAWLVPVVFCANRPKAQNARANVNATFFMVLKWMCFCNFICALLLNKGATTKPGAKGRSRRSGHTMG
jgi:hypothetical protein